MILECSECRARFLIADAALGVAGRNVRCGRCKHQWHQDPLMDTTAIGPLPKPRARDSEIPAPQDFLSHMAVQESADSALGGIIYDERRVPALRPRRPAPLWMRAGAALTLAASLLVALLAHAPWLDAHLPASRPLLAAFGARPSTGLTLADVAFSKKEEANGMRYTLGCAVRNMGATTQSLPELRMQMQGRSGGLVLNAHRLLAPIPRIAAGDEIPCDIPPALLHTGAASRIALDLGSPWELWLRR